MGGGVVSGHREIERALPHLVVSTRRTAKRCASGRACGELTPVFRNVLVHTCYLAAALDKWDAARRVSAARICAVGLALSPGWILIAQAAAFAHGIETVSDLFDIHIARPGSVRRRTEYLPEIRIPADCSAAGLVPPVRLVRHQADIEEGHLSALDAGLHLPDLATTAALCALHLPAKQSSVAVSAALRQMSAFSRFHEKVGASRAREEAARAHVSGRLRDIRARRGVRKARAVISCADAACESVPERILVWILRSAGFTEVRTQVHHRVDGRDYYVDVELPPWGVVLESDSRGKHEGAAGAIAEVHRSYERQMVRQKALESIGLIVLRFSPADYSDPDAVTREVVRRCRRTPPRPVKILLS